MTSQATKNRRAGADFEINLMKFLREQGLDVERLRLSGKEDEGDLVVKDGEDRWVIEAKSGKLLPADFANQATAETRNYEKHRNLPDRSVEGVAVIKRRGKGIGDAYVLTTVREFFCL